MNKVSRLGVGGGQDRVTRCKIVKIGGIYQSGSGNCHFTIEG